MKKNMFSSCCSAADRTALRLYGSAAEQSPPQEHNHAMEEGTETPKYDHLTVYSPLPKSERCCTAMPSARIPASPWTVFIFLPEKMTARLEQGRGQPAGFCAAGRLGG